jgi:hypothetical protein
MEQVENLFNNSLDYTTKRFYSSTQKRRAKPAKERNMKYQIKLINTKTNKAVLTSWVFTSKKKANEWAEKWKAQGEPFDCEIVKIK